MYKSTFQFLFIFFGFSSFTQCIADVINVAVAANFREPMESVSEQFSEETGHKINISYGSSGKLFSQIRHGAPYDIFLSADQDKPSKLVESGYAYKESQFTYAIGTLALWSKVDKLLPEKGFTQIDQENVKKVAIANPKLAPFGKAALEVFQSLNIYKKIEPKLVYGENVSQAFQFAFSLNAEYAFVSLSQVYVHHQDQTGYIWKVPQDLHDEIYQDAVLLKRAEGKLAAAEFMSYLQSDKAKDILHRFGYEPSNKKTN